MTGPIRFTMDAKDDVKAARKLNPRTIIPIHFEGWKLFSQGKSVIEKEFSQAGLSNKLHWLSIGKATEIEI
jgi:L-ascorbate metabolism protein UlaG (beta-lactamase superfamily)